MSSSTFNPADGTGTETFQKVELQFQSELVLGKLHTMRSRCVERWQTSRSWNC